MKIILAKTAGFCFGVRRAVALCEKVARTHERCVTLGPIIHNRSVTDALSAQGVREVGEVSGIKAGDTVIIRSHGAKKAELEALEASGADIIDATCPDVAKIHDIVRAEAKEGRVILVIGQRNHPEIEAISSWCENCCIIESPEELKEWLTRNPYLKSEPISVVFQTTNTRDVYDECFKTAKKECTNVKIFDTIANATCRRQEEAKEITRIRRLIVIGASPMQTALKLAEICRANCGECISLSQR